MADKLKNIICKLKLIKDNLVKLSQARRTPETLKNKYDEASRVYAEYVKCSELIDEQICNSEIKGSDIIEIKEICVRINTIYTQIQEFCSVSSTKESQEMEKFDLKTAVALLPIIDSSEKSVMQLISAIEMYASLLQNDGKLTLIDFVLKTRLSESAKLRLASSYTSVSNLVEDMKKHLLVQKSFTALQARLLRASQNQKTIEDYGKEIEKLFVDLTISQAEGDPTKFEILKPINEKQAIKRFSDGLRNGHLSIIISARNYTSLKDAIRGAKDEEISSGPSDGAIMRYDQGYRPNYQRFQRGLQFQRGQQRGYSHGRGGNSNRGDPPSQQWRGYSTNRGRSRGYFPRHQARGARGKSFPSNLSRDHHVHYADDAVTPPEENFPEQSGENSMFFRRSC
ncbi:hypothetical protein JYU34_005511 [Plutella xylostella]|uniref:Uncharacterized protein n=1 Tax=Plutella xylostella TaxID=51655 RepID=A0ABQ7QTF2_PLUXY|nr:hypothetical protein JYU34_005511 [Plutella xylostella]